MTLTSSEGKIILVGNAGSRVKQRFFVTSQLYFTLERSNYDLSIPHYIVGLDYMLAFRRVDEHAVTVSKQTQDNFNQLIWQLIYARNITDELEKVRVIFLWLCTKDLHKMNFDNVKPDSPEEILIGIRTGKSTYAQIFLTLCRYALFFIVSANSAIAPVRLSKHTH
ncbi:unnamed protein product [Protopolystoma xenopodis]|uniref:Uncharacterized protein n=1 Tax=Protopolystoma xenopodis TaxID=117903 RepID=A0A448WVT3_9PLAT|nr:unnamed protein product [Protopolystoma xenopodis]